MKRILVTGGFGFLGSHLVELLLRESDDRIHVVDNLSTSPLPLEDLLNEMGRPERMTYDVTDVETFCRSWKGEKYDEIYHLASVVGPAGVLSHSGRIAASIVSDTMLIMELAERTGSRLVDVSTSEVYGGGRDGLCAEHMSKIVPPKASARLEYAVGKLAAEISLLNTTVVKPLDARIVRPFNITGPRQSGKGGFVLPRFIGQAMAGMDVTVFGDGKQRRAFTHVKDMVSGILCAMRNGKKGGVYNLGNQDNRCSVLELAEDVIRVTGSRSRIAFVDPKTVYGPLYEEANDKYPDATQALETLSWRPQYDRKAVIDETYRYLKGLPERLLQHVRGF